MPVCSLLLASQKGTTRQTMHYFGCLWFDNFNTVQKQLASVIRSYITDTVPQLIYDEAKKCPEPYTEGETKKTIIDVVVNILGRRKEEMQQLINNIENGNGKGE